MLAVPVHGDRRRIVEVLGRADDLRAVLRAMIYARGLPQGFAADVLDEAAAVGARAARADGGRHDLTALPTFTIDPDTARDFDDAISVQREGDGYRAHVHIADVSYFVDDDGAIEREARRRTSSLYLPLFAEPMLPAALSSDLCSLVPRQPRKCLTVEFGFAADGRRSSVQFYRSLISSDHRLTYGFVDTIIGGAGGGEPEDGAAAPPRAPRRRRATCRGATDGRRRRAARPAAPRARAGRRAAPPPSGPRRAHAGFVRARVRLRPRGRADGRGGAPRDAVARPRRGVHAGRQRGGGRVSAAQEGAHSVSRARAARAGQGARASRRARGAGRADAAASRPARPCRRRSSRRRSAASAASSPRRAPARVAAGSAWSTLLLRSLKQARYSPANLGHFGLASPAYLHFTSPIRRYPDLVTHRSLLYHLGEGGGELGEAELAAAAEDCSTRERELARLEMDADDVALCFLLDQRLQDEGWEQEFAGEVVGLVGGGLFVRFAAVFEGFLSSRRLGGERFEVSEHETALVGEATGRRYRLGDAVTVKVEHVDRLRGKVDLAPALGRRRTAPVTGRNRTPARRSTGARPPRRGAPGREQYRRGR